MSEQWNATKGPAQVLHANPAEINLAFQQVYQEIDALSGLRGRVLVNDRIRAEDPEEDQDVVTRRRLAGLSQDAIGNILLDSTTIDFTYDDTVPSITAAAITQMSIASDASGLKLDGDVASPGNSYFYGTSGAGAKGWQANAVSGTGAANKVALWSGTSTITSDTNLHYDSTNDRLGIAQTSPTVRLETLNGDVRFARNDATDLECTLDVTTVVNRYIHFKTNGVSRWHLRALNDAESGANVGSSFEIRGFDDGGTLVGRALTIQRASLYVGLATVAGQTRLHLTSDSVANGALTISSLRAAIVAGDILGGLDVWSNDTGLTAPGQIAAYVRALATQTHTSSALGTRLAFGTTTDGATSPTEKAKIDNAGRLFITTPNSAVTDGDIGTSQVSVYVAEGTNLLTFRIRYSDGTTLKTGTVALV